MRSRHRFTATAAALLLFGAGVTGSFPAGAQEGGTDPPPPAKVEANPRVDGRLLPERLPADQGLGPGDRVTLEVYPEPGRGSVVAQALRAVGGAPRVVGDAIVVEVAAGALSALAANTDIRWIQPAAVPVAEAVTAESVSFADAVEWHDGGQTGLGVSVAVIDLGFAGWEARRDADELPGSVRTRNYCSEFEPGGFDGVHGTAVAEIVHDMAPDARLFLICIENTADLLDAVEFAAEQGVDIISHSVGWFNTGRGDGTGLLGPSFDAAAAAGITWVNSAGNYAERHWRGTFDNANSDPDDFHDFGPNDDYISFTLDNGEAVAVYLKWDDWPVSSNDFDLRLFRDDGGTLTLVTGSGNHQTGSQPPIEQFGYPNFAGDNRTFHLAIQRYSASESPEFDLFLFGVPEPIDHNDSTRSINDAAGAPFVIAAGAAWWQDGEIEYFSSRGPNIDGVVKPDITGPDGVITASYGPAPFFGTSAAAPGVAGAAALLEATNRCQSVDALKAELLASAQPKGDANTYGAGLLLLDEPPVTETLLRHDGSNRYATAVAIAQRAYPCGARVVYVSTGTNHPDALAAGPAAARENAPILLTTPESLSAVTRTELQRLDPDHVVVLGGPAAIADSVMTEIAQALPGVTVDRRWGSNRYGTAAEVSKAVFPSGVDKVFIVTGENFPDALGGAAAAVAEGVPLLIVNPTLLPDVIADELERLDPDEIVILGGTAAVSSSVQDALADIAPTSRLTAANRYALAAEVSEESWPSGSYTVYVAVGDRFPDALAAGPLTATANGPLLLVQTDSLPSVIATELDRLDPTRIVILGGPAAVSESVAAQVATYQE